MNVPLYRQIYNYLLDQINRGEIKMGGKIPSENDLADQFDVSRITSKKALDLLAQENIIERVQGKGSYVVELNDREIIPDILEEGNEDKKILRIGLVIPGFSDDYGRELIQAIASHADRHQALLLIKFTHEKIKNEENAITELLLAEVDGIIILPIHGDYYNPKILELVLQKFPIVLADRYLRGIPATSVSTDNTRGTREATEYLFSLGHQHIAYITPPYDGTTVLEDRTKGFQLAHTQQNMLLNPHYLCTNNAADLVYSIEKRNELDKEIDKLKQFIKENPEITAFVTCRYSLAKVLANVIQSLNMTVPQDYSIICFDSPNQMFGKPPFTHICQKEKEMGKQAVELLMAQIKGEKDVVTAVIDFDLVKGKSTRRI